MGKPDSNGALGGLENAQDMHIGMEEESHLVFARLHNGFQRSNAGTAKVRAFQVATDLLTISVQHTSNNDVLL